MIQEANSAEILKDVLVSGLQNKKAKSIVVLDLREIETAVSEFFIICHGTSDTHVKALAHSAEHEARETLNDKPFSNEGKENAEWMLLDYSNVVVHIFQEDAREFYGLEQLWGDAKVEHIEE